MMYQTTIPAGGPREAELRSLVEQIARISGAEIEMELQLCIFTESVEISNILDSLSDAIRNGKPVIAPVRANGHKKHRKQKTAKVESVKGEPTRGPHIRSIKIISTGEMLSRFELNKRLGAGAIELGTELHSPKHGKITVKQLHEGEMFVVENEAGELV